MRAYVMMQCKERRAVYAACMTKRSVEARKAWATQGRKESITDPWTGTGVVVEWRERNGPGALIYDDG